MFNQLQQQALNFWQAQSRVQRIVLVVLVVLGVAAIVAFTLWANTPVYQVAFTNLSEEDAGQIVEQLKADGVVYQLQDGGTILVPSHQVYEVRLSMARQGLPQNGTVGFELFGNTTLGMTEFAQKVNYQRALEGELERTIASLTAIAAVRVHIVTPEKALLTSEQQPTTAAVTVKIKPGQSMDAAQVRSITHLVSSSVEGLKPENVVLVDVDGNLLTPAVGETDLGAAANENERRRAAEAAYAAALQAKVRNLLEQVLGPNKSVVQATVTLDWTQRDITSQAFDPAGVLRSQQLLTETFTGDASLLGGIPGATSNLPALTDTTITDTTGTEYYLREELTHNYEITQQQTHELIAPGAVEQVSLSVMVDSITDTQSLLTLRTVISAAAGIDVARGDTLAVETLAFDRSFYTQQAAEMAQDAQTELYVQVAVIAGVVLLTALLLWYVYRVLANIRLASAQAWMPVMVTAGQAAAVGAGVQPVGAVAAPGALPLAAETAPASMPVSAGGAASAPTVPPAPPVYIPPMPEPPQASPEDEAMQKVIIRLAEENPATVADIIHLWLSEDDKGKGHGGQQPA